MLKTNNPILLKIILKLLVSKIHDYWVRKYKETTTNTQNALHYHLYYIELKLSDVVLISFISNGEATYYLDFIVFSKLAIMYFRNW